jgi:hypothetical protein
MYVTYFHCLVIFCPLICYTLSFINYSSMFTRTMLYLKHHVLNFILLPTSLYSAHVLFQFWFIYQDIHPFCSICLYFYIFCIFYVPKSLPTSFLFIHSSKSGHYFPLSAYPCNQIVFLYHPPHCVAPFFLHLSMYTNLSTSLQTAAKSQPPLLPHCLPYFASFTNTLP